MIEPIDIFIGYDSAREAVAYHVCVQSIISRASRPLRITPLALNTFATDYTEQHKDGSNAFIYSRFLVPSLCQWKGHAIYLDGDMIVRDDIAKLWDMRRTGIGVQVVKHDYRTRHPVKYLGAPNPDYPRKNWSSVILWNCSFHPNRKLTPEFVAGSTGSYLHRFEWLNDGSIGELPPEWNHLVGEFDRSDMAKLLHYTISTPCFGEHKDQEGTEEWWREYDCAIAPVKREAA